jgi:hypothetical protein
VKRQLSIVTSDNPDRVLVLEELIFGMSAPQQPNNEQPALRMLWPGPRQNLAQPPVPEQPNLNTRLQEAINNLTRRGVLTRLRGSGPAPQPQPQTQTYHPLQNGR